MTQDIAAPGHPEPGPDTFDFEDWLNEKHSFPTFEHTVYLDQKSGARLADVFDELEEVVGEIVALDEAIDKHRQSGQAALVDDRLNDLVEQRERLVERKRALQEEQDVLQQKIWSSRLTLHFEVKTPEELGAVTREANRKFAEENPQYKAADEGDLDYVTARSRYTIAAQIAHFCTHLVNAKGKKAHGLTVDQAYALLNRLISSETMRLMEKLGTELSASREWADKVNDAGFPGRGVELAEVGLGEDGAEGGPVVGGSATDDAHRAVNGLV